MRQVHSFCRKDETIHKSSLGCVVLLMFLLIVVGIGIMGINSLLVTPTTVSSTNLSNQTIEQVGSREKILKRELSYLLQDVDEVVWFTPIDNNVYIGFSRVPDDLYWILRGAARRGNVAIDFGCHVWAVPADASPGDVSRHYGEATARNGKVI